MIHTPHFVLKDATRYTLGFEQYLGDACVFFLIEEGRVTIISVVHVDDIFVIGLKIRRDRLRDDLNHWVPVKNVGDL